MRYDFDKIVSRKGTHSVKFDARKHYFGTDDLIPIWVADMDFPVPVEVTKALKQRADHPIYGYTLRPDSYFNTFMQWVENRHGWKIEKEWILFSPGVVPALNFIIQAFSKPGEKILIQPPVYHPFYFSVENNYREMVLNPLRLINGRYEMDFDDLEKKLSDVKMILLSNPHNPVGRAWNREELKKMAELCIKHDVLIVSDEIHSDLSMPGNRHIPVASISEEIASYTFTCMAPSKTFNLAGLSTSSVIISDPEKRARFEEYLERFHISGGNVFGMIASEAAYLHGEEWLNQVLEYVQGNFDYLDGFLKEKLPEIHLTPAEATYLAWIDFSALGMEGDELKSFMINKAKVGMNDGRTYRDGGEGFQRMNLACSRSTVVEALYRIEKAIKENK
jgi:cystathionine beta-lyase